MRASGRDQERSGDQTEVARGRESASDERRATGPGGERPDPDREHDDHGDDRHAARTRRASRRAGSRRVRGRRARRRIAASTIAIAIQRHASGRRSGALVAGQGREIDGDRGQGDDQCEPRDRRMAPDGEAGDAQRGRARRGTAASRPATRSTLRRRPRDPPTRDDQARPPRAPRTAKSRERLIDARRLSAAQPSVDREHRKLGARQQPIAIEEPAKVALDGLLGKTQGGSDLGVGRPVDDMLDDLDLAIRGAATRVARAVQGRRRVGRAAGGRRVRIASMISGRRRICRGSRRRRVDARRGSATGSRIRTGTARLVAHRPRRSARVMDGPKDVQALGARCEVHVADEDIDRRRELDGLVARSGGADRVEVVSVADGRRDGGQDRRMVVDEADADRGSVRPWIADGPSPGGGA